jgi:hypothetical protein
MQDRAAVDVVHFEHIAEQSCASEAIRLGTARDLGHVGAAGAGHASQPVEQMQPRLCPDNIVDRALQMLCKPFG